MEKQAIKERWCDMAEIVVGEFCDCYCRFPLLCQTEEELEQTCNNYN
ncbi:MAG: hypothetical protein R3Y67_04380 [Eubacteriales bacterium]